MSGLLFLLRNSSVKKADIDLKFKLVGDGQQPQTKSVLHVIFCIQVKLLIVAKILALAEASLAIDASDEENRISTRLKGSDFNCVCWTLII